MPRTVGLPRKAGAEGLRIHRGGLVERALHGGVHGVHARREAPVSLAVGQRCCRAEAKDSHVVALTQRRVEHLGEATLVGADRFDDVGLLFCRPPKSREAAVFFKQKPTKFICF